MSDTCDTCGRPVRQLRWCMTHNRFECPSCLRTNCVVNGSEPNVAATKEGGETK